MTTLQFKIRQVYGRDTMYLVNKTEAQNYQLLTGMKTLQPHTKRALEWLGVKFEQVL